MALKQDNWTYVILTRKGQFYMALNLAGIEKNVHLK